eukprot:scaffold103344_cov17-Tisochrysis_lutea.AAC.1
MPSPRCIRKHSSLHLVATSMTPPANITTTETDMLRKVIASTLIIWPPIAAEAGVTACTILVGSCSGWYSLPTSSFWAPSSCPAPSINPCPLLPAHTHIPPSPPPTTYTYQTVPRDRTRSGQQLQIAAQHLHWHSSSKSPVVPAQHHTAILLIFTSLHARTHRIVPGGSIRRGQQLQVTAQHIPLAHFFRQALHKVGPGNGLQDGGPSCLVHPINLLGAHQADAAQHQASHPGRGSING